MLWMNEVEMVDSVGEIKSSRSIQGTEFQNFEMLDAFCFEQDHPESLCQEEGQSGGTESPKRGSVSSWKTDRLHDLRLLSSHCCS